MVADESQILGAGESVVEVHGSAPRKQKNMLHALLGDEVHDVVSESHALLANLGPKQQIHNLADGAISAAKFGDHLALLPDRRASVGGTGAQADEVERGQVVHIVSNEADFLQAHTAPLGESA